MSIEQSLAELTAAVNANSALLERVVAGQQAAIEKLEAPKATRTPRKTKEEPAPEESKAEAGNAEAANTASGAASADNASDSPVAAIVVGIGQDLEKLKAYVATYTGATEDQAERVKRVQLLKDMATEFGGSGFSALLPHLPKAVFYIERAKAGLSVDFNADYDFDGDPAQGGSAPAATTSDDDFG